MLNHIKFSATETHRVANAWPIIARQVNDGVWSEVHKDARYIMLVPEAQITIYIFSRHYISIEWELAFFLDEFNSGNYTVPGVVGTLTEWVKTYSFARIIGDEV
jgi:hypothetical protein